MALAGHPVKIYLKSTNVSPVAGDEIDGINSVKYSPSVNLLDITDFKDTSGAKKKLAGLKDGTISLSGDFEPADAPQLLAMNSLGSPSLWASCHFNPSGAVGTKGFQVEVLVASFELGAEVDGKVPFTCELQFNGLPNVDA